VDGRVKPGHDERERWPRKAHLRIPAARDASELREIRVPQKTEGAGNAGRSSHPQPRMRNKKAYERSHHRFAETIRHSLHDGVTAYFALSLVIGLVCHHRRPRCRSYRRPLDIGVEISGPHGFAVRAPHRSSVDEAHVHRIPRPTFVTIAIRPSSRARNGRGLKGDLPDNERVNIFQKGDGQMRMMDRCP
jgi:hypothetical protein